MQYWVIFYPLTVYEQLTKLTKTANRNSNLLLKAIALMNVLPATIAIIGYVFSDVEKFLAVDKTSALHYKMSEFKLDGLPWDKTQTCV